MPKQEVTTTQKAREQLAAISTDIANNYVAKVNSEDAIASMAARILEAETFEEMFEGSSVDNLHESLLNTGIHVTSAAFVKSDYTYGIPFYVHFEGKRLDNGEEVSFNCGAWQVVVVAYRCVKNNWLPRNFCFVRQEKATDQGFHPVNIFPWEGAEEPF